MSPNPVILLAINETSASPWISELPEQDDYFVRKVSSVNEILWHIDNTPGIELMALSAELAIACDMKALNRILSVYPFLPVILLVWHLSIEALQLAALLKCKEVIQIPIDFPTFKIIIQKYLPATNVSSKQSTQSK